MQPASSSAEPIADAESGGGVKNDLARQRRTSAAMSRLPADRSYKASTRPAFTAPEALSVSDIALHESQPPSAAALGGATPSGHDTVTGSRHADAYTCPSPSSHPAAAAAAALGGGGGGSSSVSGAGGAAAAVTPNAVRGRSGSSAQHRAYQPSSLFGAKEKAPVAAAAAAAAAASPPLPSVTGGTTPLSLSSSHVMTDATHRRASSGVSGEHDEGSDGRLSAAGPPRKSPDTSAATPALSDTRDLMSPHGASQRRISGSSAATAAATTTAVVTPQGSADMNDAPTATNSSRRHSSGDDGDDATTTTATAATTTAAAPAGGHDASVTSVGEVVCRGSEEPPLQTLLRSSSVPLAGRGSRTASPTLQASTDACTCASSSHSSASFSGHDASPIQLTALSARTPEHEDTVNASSSRGKGRRGRGGSNSSSSHGGDHGGYLLPAFPSTLTPPPSSEARAAGPVAAVTEVPPTAAAAEPKENDEEDEEAYELSCTMARLVTRVAVPVSVKAVLRNPAATKAELWTALRAACQQCEVLQRRLARAEGKLKDDEEPEPEEAKPSKPEKKGEDGPAVRNAAKASGATQDTKHSGEAGKGAMQRSPAVASGAAVLAQEPPKAAPPAAPPVPSESAGVTRGRVTAPPTTAARKTAVAAAPDAPDDFRSRIAEVIRRVEATRKSQAGGPSPTAVSSSATATAVQGAQKPRTPAPHDVDSSSTGSTAAFTRDTSSTNLSFKSPDDMAVGKRKVREAVIKSRDGAPDTAASAPAVGKPVLKSPPSAAQLRDAQQQQQQQLQSRKAHQRGFRHRNDSDTQGAWEGEEEDEAADPRRPVSVLTDDVCPGGGPGSDEDADQAVMTVTENDVSSAGGDGHTLPSIPSATAETLRRSSVMSRSHNSGRLVPIRPPSSAASDGTTAGQNHQNHNHNTMSIASSGGGGGTPASPQQQPAAAGNYRRPRASSFASVESASNTWEGSVGSGGHPSTSAIDHHSGGANGAMPNQSSAASSALRQSTGVKAAQATSTNTLSALKGEGRLAPLQQQQQCLNADGSFSRLVPVEEPQTAAAAAATNHVRHDKGMVPLNGLARPSSGVGAAGVCGSSPMSPLNGPLPSIPSSSSLSQRPLELAVPLVNPGDAMRGGGSVKHPSTMASSQLLSPVPQGSSSGGGGGGGGGGSGSAHSSSVSPSILEMVRLAAEEDAPVPPPADEKKAELREWRRQAAKMGLRGAPPTC